MNTIFYACCRSDGRFYVFSQYRNSLDKTWVEVVTPNTLIDNKEVADRVISYYSAYNGLYTIKDDYNYTYKLVTFDLVERA